MKLENFVVALQNAINEVRAENGVNEKIELVPCDVVQICSNGRHKDVESGRFVLLTK